ncbi:hypothetical protein [Streptomyces sp. NPDC059371]|uniref:hypothetical protein n=1 Tax=Streptomyces sp. NPDC059371 TaxID=3346812 RepID=UPI00368098D2
MSGPTLVIEWAQPPPPVRLRAFRALMVKLSSHSDERRPRFYDVNVPAERVVLDHLLEVLPAKPGSLAGSEALDQARRVGTFPPAHEAFWFAAKHALGESDGTKALVHVLLLHRRLQHRDVVTGIQAALAARGLHRGCRRARSAKGCRDPEPAPDGHGPAARAGGPAGATAAQLDRTPNRPPATRPASPSSA